MISDALDLDDDKLPQPYRMLNRILNNIIDSAWEVIEQNDNTPKQEYREMGASILNPTDFQTVKLQAGSPRAVGVADSDVYTGTLGGCVERFNVLFGEVNLVSNALHTIGADSTEPSPITCISVNHLFIPITMTTDGKEVKVVCFPLPPREQTRKSSTINSSSSARSSIFPTESPEPTEEKDRMITLLHCTEEMLQFKPVLEVSISQCGHFLAIIQQNTVMIYTLKTIEIEVDSLVPEFRPPIVITAPVVETKAPVTKPSRSPVAKDSKGKQPAVPDEIEPTNSMPSSSVMPKLHWGSGGEGEKTSFFVVTWLGGYTAVCEVLPSGDSHMENVVNNVNDFIKIADADRMTTPAGTTGKDPTRKASKITKSIPISKSSISDRKPRLSQKPVSLHRGERKYSCTTQITASSLSLQISDPVLALGCVDGHINIYSLTSYSLLFSTCVNYRLGIRNPQTCYMKCLAITVWGSKYCASSWSWSVDDGNVRNINTSKCDIYIHSIKGNNLSVDETNQKESIYQQGDFIEVLLPTGWKPAVISSVTNDTIEYELLKHVQSPNSSIADVHKIVINYSTTTSSGIPVNVRRLSLLSVINHVPLCYCLQFAPRAPILFYTPMGSRVTVFDVLQLKISAVIPFTDINQNACVLGCGVNNGIPDTEGDANHITVILASTIASYCCSILVALGSPRSRKSVQSEHISCDDNENEVKKSTVSQYRSIQHTHSLLSSNWCVGFSDGVGIISCGSIVHEIMFTMISLPTIISHLYPAVGESLLACGDVAEVYYMMAKGCYFRSLQSSGFVSKRLVVPPRASIASSTVRTKPSAKSKTTSATQRVGFDNTEAETLVTFDDESHQGPAIGIDYRCAAFLEVGRRERSSRKDQVATLLSNIHKQYCG